MNKKEQLDLYRKYKNNDLTPTGKVVILKDSERVVDKWSLRLLYAVAFLTALSGLLRLIGWVMS